MSDIQNLTTNPCPKKLQDPLDLLWNLNGGFPTPEAKKTLNNDNFKKKQKKFESFIKNC